MRSYAPVVALLAGACASSLVGFPEGEVLAVHSSVCIEVADPPGTTFGLLPNGWTGDPEAGVVSGSGGVSFGIDDVIIGSARSQLIESEDCGAGPVQALQMTNVEVR